jgi:nicotinate-nucleotide adenylyltransferase
MQKLMKEKEFKTSDKVIRFAQIKDVNLRTNPYKVTVLLKIEDKFAILELPIFNKLEDAKSLFDHLKSIPGRKMNQKNSYDFNSAANDLIEDIKNSPGGDNKNKYLPIGILQNVVNKTFTEAFGTTPLTQRLDDILGEAIELSRYTDLKNLREETGDLLASTLQLVNECGWDVGELIQENRDKIRKRQLQYKSLGRKKKIALLGGAFDPIHKGHIELAQFVLNTSKTFDEVWLMPCYQHMYNKQMESAEHRLEMCRIAAQNDGRLKVFDFEIEQKLSGETYNMVKRLQDTDQAKHECDFSVIMGLDNANTFSNWVNYEELERMIRFVVVQRQGYEIDPKVDWYLKTPHIFLGDAAINNMSSTRIRSVLARREQQVENMLRHIPLEHANEKVKEGIEKAIGYGIDPEVLNYIYENNLYARTSK